MASLQLNRIAERGELDDEDALAGGRVVRATVAQLAARLVEPARAVPREMAALRLENHRGGA